MRAQLFLILAISLAACNSAPTLSPSSSAPIVGPVVPVGQPEIRDLGPSTETVWNCGSGGGTVVKHPSMSVATNWAVEWEVGGTAGTGVRIGDGVIPGGVDLSVSLEGHYANKFDQSIQQGTGWDLPAEPNTVVVYTLMWREVWQPGYVDVRLADQSIVKVNVRYRTGIQSEIVGKQQQSCTGEQTSQPIPTQAPTLAQPVQSDTALINRLFLGSNVSLSSLTQGIQNPSQVSQEQLEGVVRTIQSEADRLHSARVESNSTTLSADNWWLIWCSNVPAQYSQPPTGWSYLFGQKLPTFGQLYVVSPTAQNRLLESCNSPKGWWAVVVYLNNP
jgi:hypothetical protein